MSNPQFNGTELVTRAGRDLPGGVAARYYAETMPGVDGLFVQTHGTAGRRIAVRGILQASGETPSAAHQALKTLLRARQALADGRTVASYVGSDGHSYSNCMLVSYEPAGEVVVSSAGPLYTATMLVAAVVLQLLV